MLSVKERHEVFVLQEKMTTLNGLNVLDVVVFGVDLIVLEGVEELCTQWNAMTLKGVLLQPKFVLKRRCDRCRRSRNG